MNRRDEIIIKKIIEEIDVSNQILQDIQQETFLNDEAIKRAIAMTAINIGELVKHITDETCKQHPEIPWKQIAGFRDVTAHGYQTLNMEDVYNTAIKDYPTLKKQLVKLIEDEKN